MDVCRWTRCGVIVGSLVLAACGGGPQSTDSPLRMGYQHALVSLDPHAQNDGVTGAVLSSVYDALVWLEPGAMVRPGLAERWTTPNDTTWRFTLRAGASFHDGRPVRAEDVVASLRRARFDPESRLATYIEVIDDIRVSETDPAEVVVTTIAPFPLLLSRISMVAITPAGFDPSHPVGSGPYRWVGGSRQGPISLRRHAGYWGEAPVFDEVEIRFVDDDARLAELLGAEQLDVMAHVSADFVSASLLGVGWELVRIPTAATTILGINVARAPLADARLREAIDLAVDRRGLIASAFPEGLATVAESVVSPEVFGFGPTVVARRPDQERARRLLAEVFADEPAALRLDHSGVYQPVVDYLVQSFAEVGLQVTPVSHPYEDYYRRIEQAENELFVFGWTFNFADASDFLDAVVHTRDPDHALGLLNGAAYSNPAVDGWIEAAASEARTRKRLELLRWALSRVHHDRPYLPLYHRSRLAVVRSGLEIAAGTGSWARPQDVRRRDGER